MNDANPLQAIAAARLGDISVSLHALLRREHSKGGLIPWLRRAVTEALLLEQARALGLRVDDGELQHAADGFRRRNGLLSSTQMHAWFQEQELSADDFEAALESDLLARKLHSQVASPQRVNERFAAGQQDYDHLRLRWIVVAREDLAREIVTQVNEEGADFAALAAQHSLLASRKNGGAIGVVFRCQVEPQPIREALKDAKAGDVVGPVAAGDGFHLVLTEEISPGTLDAVTSALIGRQLFQEWLADKLAALPFSVPLVDALRS